MERDRLVRPDHPRGIGPTIAGVTDVSDQCAPVSAMIVEVTTSRRTSRSLSGRSQDLRQLEQRASLAGTHELQPLRDRDPTDGHRTPEERGDGDQPVTVTHREHGIDHPAP